MLHLHNGQPEKKKALAFASAKAIEAGFVQARNLSSSDGVYIF